MSELLTPTGPAAAAHPGSAPTARHSGPFWAVSDSLTMVARSLRLSIRNPDALVTAIALPVMLMLLFVYLFGGAIQTGTAYVNYVVPGVILLCTSFGASMTAMSVCQDMVDGIIDRFRSMDIASFAVLTGHVAATVVRNVVSTSLVIVVALLIGFRPNATVGEWVAVIGLLALFVLAMAWLSATVGLIAKTPEAASGFTFFVMFLPYVSSAFVPVETMPSWLHGFAENQPVTPIIETLRGLLLGTPIGNNGWLALGWCLGILAVFFLAATALFRRQTTR